MLVERGVALLRRFDPVQIYRVNTMLCNLWYVLTWSIDIVSLPVYGGGLVFKGFNKSSFAELFVN